MEFRQRLERLHAHPNFTQAQAILERLQASGHVAVLAGGCVRDGLLGKAPNDLDIATSAHPDVVEALFTRTLAVGKAFGTIVVVEGGHNYEVTTFRREGPYLDGRRPSEVLFTEMAEDAQRRDFTVNALFYDPKSETVFDFVGGLEDLRSRSLRAVGAARARFMEDRLRMLRAIRFVSQLGFDLDQECVAAIAELHAEFKSVSAERVLSEVKRMLVGEHLRGALEVLLQTHLAQVFWPEILGLKTQEMGVFVPFLNWENAFAAIMLLLSQDPEVRMKAWKVSRESQVAIREQMRFTRVLLATDSKKVDRVRALGGSCYAEILVLAEGLSQLQKLNPEILQRYIQDYLAVAEEGGGLPAPYLTGEDLKRAGVPPGARMGEILKDLYDQQLLGELRGKDDALKNLKRYLF